MRKCKECGRPLKAEEKDLCPACSSEKSSKWRRAAEVAGTVVVVAIAGILRRRRA